MPGYHLARVERGTYGETSKIREELDELRDAEAQGVRLMGLVEMPDLLGAIRGYAELHHPGHDVGGLPDPAPGLDVSMDEALGMLLEADAKGGGEVALAAAVSLLHAAHGHLARHYPGTSLADLEALGAATRRAFLNGRRAPSPVVPTAARDRTVVHHQV